MWEHSSRTLWKEKNENRVEESPGTSSQLRKLSVFLFVDPDALLTKLWPWLTVCTAVHHT